MWTGWYEQNGQQHEMDLNSFVAFPSSNGIIQGSGQDQVSPFTFQGNFDYNGTVVKFKKQYNGKAKHCIFYEGQAQFNPEKIVGFWGFQAGQKNGRFQFSYVNDNADNMWTGWYQQNNARHAMEFNSFEAFPIPNGAIRGDGQDTVGEFTFQGNFDQNVKGVQFKKQYHGKATHAIFYKGSVSIQPPKITGFWGFNANQQNGKFQLQFGNAGGNAGGYDSNPEQPQNNNFNHNNNNQHNNGFNDDNNGFNNNNQNNYNHGGGGSLDINQDCCTIM